MSGCLVLALDKSQQAFTSVSGLSGLQVMSMV